MSLKCKNGKAVVELHLELDSLSDPFFYATPPPPPPRQTFARPSPSRLRWCARRLRARAHARAETNDNLSVILTHKSETTESVVILTDQTKVATAQVAPTDDTGTHEAGNDNHKDCQPPAEETNQLIQQKKPVKMTVEKAAEETELSVDFSVPPAKPSTPNLTYSEEINLQLF